MRRSSPSSPSLRSPSPAFSFLSMYSSHSISRSSTSPSSSGRTSSFFGFFCFLDSALSSTSFAREVVPLTLFAFFLGACSSSDPGSGEARRLPFSFEDDSACSCLSCCRGGLRGWGGPLRAAFLASFRARTELDRPEEPVGQTQAQVYTLTVGGRDLVHQSSRKFRPSMSGALVVFPAERHG